MSSIYRIIGRIIELCMPTNIGNSILLGYIFLVNISYDFIFIFYFYRLYKYSSYFIVNNQFVIHPYIRVLIWGGTSTWHMTHDNHWRVKLCRNCYMLKESFPISYDMPAYQGISSSNHQPFFFRRKIARKWKKRAGDTCMLIMRMELGLIRRIASLEIAPYAISHH